MPTPQDDAGRNNVNIWVIAGRPQHPPQGRVGVATPFASAPAPALHPQCVAGHWSWRAYRHGASAQSQTQERLSPRCLRSGAPGTLLSRCQSPCPAPATHPQLNCQQHHCYRHWLASLPQWRAGSGGRVPDQHPSHWWQRDHPGPAPGKPEHATAPSPLGCPTRCFLDHHCPHCPHPHCPCPCHHYLRPWHHRGPHGGRYGATLSALDHCRR